MCRCVLMSRRLSRACRRHALLTLTLTLSLAECSALIRPRRHKEPHDDTLTAAVPSPREARLRRWLDRPATKGGLLVLAGGVSAIIAKSATAPLERAKLMSQAGQTGSFVDLMKEVRCESDGRGSLTVGQARSSLLSV